MSVTQLRKLNKAANDKLDLAATYLSDGAPRTSARCLREAADALEKFADLRDKMTGAPAPKAPA